MPTRNQQARERLNHVLSREAGISAAELASTLNISLATLHRLLNERLSSILITGKARRTRYALRRPLRGTLTDIPVYQIDEQGRISPLSTLIPVYPGGCWMPMEGSHWPVDDEQRQGWWDGLPYPLYHLQPQGFMGRSFARAVHQALEVPDNPLLWTDDQLLHVLMQKGSDLSGNLIVGDPACERWQQGKLNPVSPIKPAELEEQYVSLAELALSSGDAGSSAAGEFPKFTAMRELTGSATPHVIVKFSGAENSAAVTRWRDLLVCEHLALQHIQELPDQIAAPSRILRHNNRTFLEVERFDRHGPFGRSPLISLEIVNAALLGKAPADWTQQADELCRSGLISNAQRDSIHLQWWYGKLIANSDMHLGNLSFRPQQGTLQLAPSYDMLPMLYAPLAGGEVPPRQFEPPLPLPRQQQTWLTACHAAIGFWLEAAEDSRITDDFRQTARANGHRLMELREKI